MEKITHITGMCDPLTRGHQNRVSALAVLIGRQMALPPDQIENIRLAGLIHDVGMICLPPEFLVRLNDLSKDESIAVESHPMVGLALLKHSGISTTVMQSVLQHHERINGSGYPKRLKGFQILTEAKVIAVADAVDMMTNHRPSGISVADGITGAVKEIAKHKGIYYDKSSVSACLDVIPKIPRHFWASASTSNLLDHQLTGC